MAQDSPIEWTDKTWNPIRGCTRVSEGCRNCYAERVAARFSKPGQAYHGLAHHVGGEARWTGELRLVEHALAEPLRWTKPTRIFVNSMSDLFHEKLSDADIDRVFAVMALAPRHTFQVLTKRADRMRAYMAGIGNGDTARWHTALQGFITARGSFALVEAFEFLTRRGPLLNVWLGVSVENQEAADTRIPDLLATAAAVRFLSCEPLLGPVVLDSRHMSAEEEYWDFLRGERGPAVQHIAIPPKRTAALDWVICGGESGPRRRPTDVAWHLSLRRQCKSAGVAFFEKQIDKVQPVPADLLVREFPRVA